jgi:quinoprotein glucose dehydrogenase
MKSVTHLLDEYTAFPRMTFRTILLRESWDLSSALRLIMNRTGWLALALTLGTLCACSHKPNRKPNEGRWRDWPVYSGGPDSIHYSGLAQINRSNVKQLQVAWTFDAADSWSGSEMECNPIVVNRVLYATTARADVIALDAATGKLRWRFDPAAREHVRLIDSKMRSRAVTYWSDGKDQRIFSAARQYLYSLDAQTGKPVESFGAAGRIDLRDDLPRDDLGRDTEDWVTMTSPGIVYRDLLIVGSSVSETLPAALGDIRAYDVRTGKLRWSFHAVPRPGEFGYETWPKDAWKYTGAANDWAGFSLDAKRGLVFVPTGSAAYDFYGANRVGNDLFANSLIALKADTGERVWHFQTVRHDIWDRDLPAQPSLVTVQRDGHDVDAVAQTTKSGFVFLFDRESGKPLFPIEYRKYPGSDLDGEVAADSQPLPTTPPPFARQQLTEDMLTQRTPQAHEDALNRFRKVRSGGQFVPGSREGTVIFPGFDGGGEWGGAAFDPSTHLLYVNANEMAWILRMLPQKQSRGAESGKSIYLRECAACHKANLQGTPPEFPSLVGLRGRYSEGDISAFVSQGGGRMPSFARLGADGLHAVVNYVYTGQDIRAKNSISSTSDMRYVSDGYNRFLDPDGYPAIQPPWGTLTAINLDTGKIVWQRPLGEYPELAAQGMKDTGSENYGGPVVTAGGLLFIAATSYDNKIRAFDRDSGDVLWEATLPAAGNATPATYQVDGRQFVVIAAGGGKAQKRSGIVQPASAAIYVAYALPK